MYNNILYIKFNIHIYIYIEPCEGQGNAEASQPQLEYEAIDPHPATSAWDDLIHLQPIPPTLETDLIDLDAVRSTWPENEVIDLHPAVPSEVKDDDTAPISAPPTPLENAPHG